MSALLRTVVPVLQVPVAGKTASDVRAEVVKEQTSRSAQIQQARQAHIDVLQPVTQSAAETSATETNGDDQQLSN